MDKIFTPQNIEATIYQQWMDHDLFKPTFDPNKENYSIVLPPPNVTGTLHMGHAFQHTLMDILIRYNRMLGKNTLWQCGTDHAGIATQMVVERKIATEESKTRHDYGREAFIEKIWEWKEYSGGTIVSQIKQLGNSLDWSREAFTLDEARSIAVKKVFIQLYKEGYIYRGKRLVNWDPKLKTAISDLEVENRNVKTNLWSLRYKLEDGVVTQDGKDYIVVSTTRPETVFGDSAVAINPKDQRFVHLVGKKVFIPVVERWVPIIADEYVDKEFGTGLVKITPAHDFNDYEVGKRHQLPILNILDPEANLLNTVEILTSDYVPTGEIYTLPVDFQGLERFQARKLLITKFEELGVLEKIEDYETTIPYGDRGGVVIEPYLTDQWYLNVKNFAEIAKDVVAKGQIKIVPEQYTNMYNNWLNNIQDWCISRQLWWGHRIPAYYDDEGNEYVGDSEAAVRQEYNLDPALKLTQDEYVLDTWFSSALWTFSTLGWPNHTKEMEFFHPTSVLVTGFDIIFFWAARMIMMTTHFCKNSDGTPQVPFKTLYITGLINDEEGNKMSKSKGNVLDPLDMVNGISLENLISKRTSNMMQPQLAEKIAKRTTKQFPHGIQAHGSDALRFTLCALASTGRNINWDIKRLEGYRNFCNKLWNASRFVILNLESQNVKISLDADTYAAMEKYFTVAEYYIEAELHRTLQKVELAINTYRFDQLANHVYDFIWNKFCNWYIEFAKVNLNSSDINIVKATQYQLLRILEASLRMAHVIMPYITEEIWQNLKKFITSLDGYIMVQQYPLPSNFQANETALNTINQAQELITEIREIRAEMNISPAKTFAITLVGKAEDFCFLDKAESLIKKLAKISEINISQEASTGLVISRLFGNNKVEFNLQDLVDLDVEINKNEIELKRLIAEIERIDNKLANESFIEKAPTQLIEKEKDKRANYLEQYTQVELQLQKLLSLKKSN